MPREGPDFKDILCGVVPPSQIPKVSAREALLEAAEDILELSDEEFRGLDRETAGCLLSHLEAVANVCAEITLRDPQPIVEKMLQATIRMGGLVLPRIMYFALCHVDLTFLEDFARREGLILWRCSRESCGCGGQLHLGTEEAKRMYDEWAQQAEAEGPQVENVAPGVRMIVLGPGQSFTFGGEDDETSPRTTPPSPSFPIIPQRPGRKRPLTH